MSVESLCLLDCDGDWWVNEIEGGKTKHGEGELTLFLEDDWIVNDYRFDDLSGDWYALSYIDECYGIEGEPDPYPDFTEHVAQPLRVVEGMHARFVTLDSGEHSTFDSGMMRDTQSGKPRFDLLIPNDVPYEDQFLTRCAALMGRGADKYEDRNWERANSAEELARMKSSALRHFLQWYCGETDEDHAAAVVFGLIAHDTTEYKMLNSSTINAL